MRLSTWIAVEAHCHRQLHLLPVLSLARTRIVARVAATTAGAGARDRHLRADQTTMLRCCGSLHNDPPSRLYQQIKKLRIWMRNSTDVQPDLTPYDTRVSCPTTQRAHLPTYLDLVGVIEE
jgi:hypothetical protein